MASDPHVLGNPLLKTQHFIGSSKWEKVSDSEAVGWHQLRVPHQRYTDESRTEIAVKGHAHGTNQHWYRKVDGIWKFAGLAPEIKWGEFDFDKVFETGRETFGDQEKLQEEAGIAVGLVETATIGGAVQTPARKDYNAEMMPIDVESVHTASGIRNTLEELPREVKARMMEQIPDKNHSHNSIEAVVGAREAIPTAI